MIVASRLGFIVVKPEGCTWKQLSLSFLSKSQTIYPAVMRPLGCARHVIQYWYADGYIPAEYNVYGESADIVSRLPPSSAIDTVVNEFVTTNLGVASTVLLADVLAAAER